MKERSKMRQPMNQQRVAKLLLFVTTMTLSMVSTMSLMARAQQEPADERGGGVSFAGGQMVRGTVTAIAADHLTVKTEAGDVYQVALSANTRVTRDRQPVK